MSTPIISKGSSFNLSVGDVELKSIIIADPTPTVGEAANTSVTAHDGTKYTTVGETGDNNFSVQLLQTLEEFADIMTFGYGSPSVVGSISTWDLTAPSGTTGTLTITSPTTGGKSTGWILVNAKALSITPASPIGNFATMTLNMSGDNWKSFLNENVI